MKKIFYPILIIFLAYLTFFGVKKFIITDYSKSPKAEHQEKIVIATTIFPLYDIAKNICQEKMEVIQILPSGASAHSFELNPLLVKQLSDAQVIFKIGGIDDWIDDISENVSDTKLIELNEGINLIKNENHQTNETEDHEHAEFDPHYWLTPANAQIIAQNIFNQLVLIDVSNKEYYQNNLNSYISQLQQLDLEISEKLQALPNKNILVSHDAWQYFTKYYGLNIAGIFSFSGKETTPENIKKITKAAQQYTIKSFFAEPQIANELFEPLALDLNLTIYKLDPLGGAVPNDSYIKLMSNNAQTIFDALNQ